VCVRCACTTKSSVVGMSRWVQRCYGSVLTICARRWRRTSAPARSCASKRSEPSTGISGLILTLLAPVDAVLVQAMVLMIGVMLMGAARDDYADNSQGIRRKDIVRPHRASQDNIRPLTPPRHPRSPDGLLDEHYTVLHEPPRTQSEQERLDQLAKEETNWLGPRPVPNITPTRGPRVNGKQTYELKVQKDKLHPGYHTMHAILGSAGGGVIRREDGVAHPTSMGLRYENEIAHYVLDFGEMIQAAACACDARGISWGDACRLLEQIIRDLNQQEPPPEPPPEPPRRGA
jgi:hypothetical protein